MPSESESRVQVLTESLVAKQAQVQALLADKTALALQLEAERQKVCVVPLTTSASFTN
jgi:hypothetical protein